MRIRSLFFGLLVAATAANAQTVFAPSVPAPVSVTWACKLMGADGRSFDVVGKIVQKQDKFVANVSSTPSVGLDGDYVVSQHHGSDQYEMYKNHEGGGVNALHLILGSVKFNDAVLYVTSPERYGDRPADYSQKFLASGLCSYTQKFFE